MRRVWCACLIIGLCTIHCFHLCHASDGEDLYYDYDDTQWDVYNDEQEQEDDALESSDWQFDDPFFFYPSDDATVAEMKENLKAYRDEEQRISDKRKEHIIHLLSVGSCTLLGLILGIFSASVSLYYAHKVALMIRYNNEGLVTDANIVASDPNIEGLMKIQHEKSSKEEIKTLANKTSDGNSEQAINDSYSIMSDDDDTNYASFSSSKGSSSSESVPAADDDDSQRGGNDEKNLSSKRPNERNKSVDKLQKNDFESVWKSDAPKQQIPSSQRFVVVVEYKAADFSYRLRKRLSIMGSDIKVSESKGMTKMKVPLFVLKGSPKSGQCCGEIQRALNWKMQLSFFFILSSCLVLTMVAMIATSKLLSRNWFVAYLAVLLLIVTLQIICLDTAFTNVVAKQYLDDGRDLPIGTKLKNASFERKELDMTLKHGLSFV